MPSIYGPSIYFATDKNIFDALIQKRVTMDQIKRVLFERGIIVSNEISKTEIASYVSRMINDYHDSQFLSSLFENPGRKEKATSTKIDVNPTCEELHKACNDVKKAIETLGDNAKVSSDSKCTEIVVQYTEVDYTKTELRQRITKTCVIEIQQEGSELIIRRPANSKAEEIANEFKKALSILKEKDLNEKIISLEAFIQPEARTYFFHELIRSIDGYALDDVKTVSVYHGVEKCEDADEENEDDLSSEFTGHIRKAALNGDSVLESAEFSQLHKNGFFISRVVWTAIEKGEAGDKFEFEAQFGNAETCTDYKYLARGVYSKNEDGFNISKRGLSSLERSILMRKLEEGTQKTYEKLIEKYGESE